MPARSPRAAELEALVRYHQDKYYNAEPEIPDHEFDSLWDELRSIEPDNPLFSEVSPESTDGFPKAAHVIPMGSQEKAADPESFSAWAKKMSFDLFFVQYKLDGASLELQYSKGVFSRAVTRGDGKIGDDISFNAKKMKGVVHVLSGDWGPEGKTPFTGGVRGEVIMTRDVHARYFPDKANCRNAANGLMKRKDGAGCEHLRVICYDASSSGASSDDPLFRSEQEKLERLKNAGFDTVPAELCRGDLEVIAHRSRVMDMRPSLPYDIDGLVVKGLDIDYADLARSRPEKQIAFKFSLEEAVTVLREVEWSESGATYTPIAIIDPVQLAGTTVQRANLANPNIIASLDLKIGSRVVVVKRGEIIPKIESLVENPPDAAPIEQPASCSSCGTALADEGTRLYCPNALCPKRIHHRLEKWISVLDIRDFGTGLIRRLFDSSRVRSIPDLYTLTEEELSSLDRMGELSAAKVLKSLRSRPEVSLPAFIAGFDIEGIGEAMVEKLVEAGLDTIDKLFSASAEDFSRVRQFGPIMAKDFFEGLASVRLEMERLLESGAVRILPPLAGGILSGLSFCFTGELSSMKRPQAEQKVKDLGGIIKTSVVKGLSYLVTNDPSSGSSKNRKAESLGIPVIGEKEFLALLQDGPSTAGSPAAPQMELNL